MRHFPLLLVHEIRMLAVSVATYSAAVLFLIVMGLFYFLVLSQYDSELHSDPPTTLYFRMFFIPVFFVVPLLTMKSLAEERRFGTLETLLTTPASALEIVLAKYFAAYLFYVALWALTLLFPWIAITYLHANQPDSPLRDTGSLIGGFLFVCFSGLLYIAIGVFASSLTRNTLVAGMLSFSMLFVLIIGGGLLPKMPLPADWLTHIQPAVDYLQTFQHLLDFSSGMVDTRPFFLYASNALLVLGITTLVVEGRATA
ncbi:MAG TPA: ABC transporter permease [Opitutales bacterium]|jgi:ABC-2 type transport system permease protein|nr:ABC transporter permease [Opitutales bacterium]